MGNEADFVAADGNEQSIAVGMLVDVAREFLRGSDEGEFRIGGVAESPRGIDYCAAYCQGDRSEAEKTR